MKIDIYNSLNQPFNGLSIRAFSVSEEMGKKTISSSVYSHSNIQADDWIGCYVDFRGDRFFIFQTPTKVKNNSKSVYEYSVKLESIASVLSKWYFLDLVPSESLVQYTGLPSVNFFGNVSEFASRLQANLDSKAPNEWTVLLGSAVEIDDIFVQFSFSETYISDALSSFTDLLGYKYSIARSELLGNVVTLGVAGVEINTAETPFQYGKDNQLYGITRTPSGEDFINRIIPVGSERNIPYDYYRTLFPDSALYAQRLMPKVFRDSLATTWWYDSLLDQSGIIKELYKEYDDIYPSIKDVTFNGNPIDEIVSIGQIGSDELVDGKPVTSKFDVNINALGFNLMSHLSEKGALQVYMTSGACAGCTFDVNKVNDDVTNSAATAISLYVSQKIVHSDLHTNDAFGGTPPVSEVSIGSFLKYTGKTLYFKSLKLSSNSYAYANAGNGGCSISFILQKRKSADTSWTTVYASNDIAIPDNEYTSLANIEIFPEIELSGLDDGVWIFQLLSDITGAHTLEGEGLPIGEAYIMADFNPYDAFITDTITVVQPEPETPSTDENVLVLSKDLNTFGVLMPNTAQTIASGDKFVFLGINLPEEYIIAKELELENTAKADLAKIDFQKYTYSINIKENYLAENASIEELLKVCNKIYISDTSEPIAISQLAIEYKNDSILPSYTITLNETTKVIKDPIVLLSKRLNKIQTSASSSAKDSNLAIANTFVVAKRAEEMVMTKATQASSDSSASLTSATLGQTISSSNEKNAPIDADKLVLSDSADSNSAKYITWAYIKSRLKTYFDTLYAVTASSVGTLINSTSARALADADLIPVTNSNSAHILSKITWANLKSAISTALSSTFAASNHSHSGVYEPIISTKGTAFNKNYETSTSNIKVNGQVSVGSSDTIPRADHVHPIDTSRAAKNGSSSEDFAADELTCLTFIINGWNMTINA